MGNLKFISDMVDNKLLSLHTAYLAKVISTNGKTAKIQPLGKTKAYGGEAQSRKPLTNVPIINSARYKYTAKEITYVTGVINHVGTQNTDNFAIVEPISAGDIVIVVCCERNITEAKKGNDSTPVIGHHSMSDSVIVGIL